MFSTDASTCTCTCTCLLSTHSLQTCPMLLRVFCSMGRHHRYSYSAVFFTILETIHVLMKGTKVLTLSAGRMRLPSAQGVSYTHAIHVYTHALIMHIGFLACFHAISLECSRFKRNRHVVFLALVALKLLVSLISRLVACSARIVADKQTHRTTTVSLAAHAHRGLMRDENMYT